jgi:hypothetical protein
VGLLAGQSWATYKSFTSRFPGGNDFYTRWANGCALIWTGENPYSDEVTVRTQIGMYGRPARSGEDQAAYSYPLYALFFFWPLCFIRTYPLVQAIWMTLMLYALLAGTLLVGRLTRWRPPTWLWGTTLAWAVFNYPHTRALILGQMATMVFLATAVTLWALREERDWLAGAMLAVTTVKPQMSFLLVPWVLWWAAWRRRWEVWKGLGLAAVLLVGISLVLVPSWMTDFVEAVRGYDSVAGAFNRHSLTWIIMRQLLNLTPLVNGVGLTIFTVYALAEAWWGRRAEEWSKFLWTTGLLLILTNFIAPRTATPHYTMLLVPLFAWFAQLQRHLRRKGMVLIAGIELALLIGQWAIFIATVEDGYEGAFAYLPTPLLLLAVQLLSRRAWLQREWFA